MATIVTRAGKGSPLTNNEVDANFTNLNSDKLESGDTVASLTITSADINGGTIDGVTIGGASAGAATFTSATVNGNITVTGTVDGRDVATDGTKLDGIEAGADVTDATNVTAAGALMDSELTDITAVKALDQGVATTDSPSFAGLSVNGNPLPTAGSLSNRNKIINGNFDIWQRGTSGTSGYVADRWNTVLNGSTAAITQQSFTLGQTDVPGEPTYFHRTVVTSVAGVSNYALLLQRIEDVRTFAGQTATLSFWAKADAAKNIAVEFLQSFGSGGSPSAFVAGIGVTTCALTTAWQKFTVTVAVPSISGKTLGTSGNDFLSINFWFDAGSVLNSRTNSLGQQSGTFDIAQVQLEAGDTATPFEHRSIGQELALCQRYYSIFRPQAQTPVTQFMITPFYFPVQMRAIPTLTQISAGSSVSAAINGAVADSTFGGYFQISASAANGYVLGAIYSASAEL